MFGLIPREEKFFAMFKEMTCNIIEGAELLKDMLDNFADPVGSQRKIKDVEHKGDSQTHDIIKKLNKSFITPFDREDIHYLATSIDDIADTIYATAKKINFYHVDPNDSGIKKLAEIIEQSAGHVCNALVELKNMKNVRLITESLVKINSMENQADDIFDLSIEKLFETEPDAKEVIKKREIYTVMEITTDKCEDAANVIESIIIKYA